MLRHSGLLPGLLAAGIGLQVGIDVNAIGPRVGAVVSDFSLPDQTGVTRSLGSTAGPKGTMLVFFRSADW